MFEKKEEKFQMELEELYKDKNFKKLINKFIRLTT